MKRRIRKIVELPANELLIPRLKYRWEFQCGHVELRSHKTVSGNGGDSKGFFGICKQCSGLPARRCHTVMCG